MIKKNIKVAHTLSITIRDADLKFYQKQCQIPPCRSSELFSKTAFKLFTENFTFLKRVRLLGISVSGFDERAQISLFDEKTDKFDDIMSKIRQKYGHNKIVRANALLDSKISSALAREQLDKKSDD